MEKVRFGVVGLGNMGGVHVTYIDKLEGAQLTAVTDIDEAKVKRYTQNNPNASAKSFLKYQDMLDSGLCDAILIATPHYFHPEIAKAAFERNLHVLCEKPVAVTVGAARDLNQAYAKKPNLKFGLMFQMRTNGMWIKLRDVVQSGELGDISRITWLITDWFRSWTYYASGGWRATWAGEGGGVLLNQCPHNLDLIQWIPNMLPSRVTAVATIGKTHPIEVEDEVSAILEYPNGAIGHFVTTTGEAPGSNRLEIAGDRGKIVAENGKLTFYRTRVSVKEHRETTPHSFLAPESWSCEIPYNNTGDRHEVVTQNFVKAVLNNEPLIAPGPEGVRGLEIGNAIMLSGLTRKAVDLPVDAATYDAFIQDNIKKYGGKKTLKERDAVVDMATSFKQK